MFNRLLVILLTILYSSGIANDIYIEQVGDNLDLDIVQDGQDNEIGDSTTDMTLNGDNMTFSITQTGSFNTIDAIIKGATYTGTWSFTGDSNTVDLLCSSTTTGKCDTVTLNITTVGDDNVFDFDIGEVADASSSSIVFTLTGDNNVTNVDVDGQSASVNVTVDNSSSLSTNSANSDEGVAMNIDVDGDGDSVGHTILVDITGGGGTLDITQSGIYDNNIDLDVTGDDFDIDITQSD